jgi:hypothetical protein
LAANDEGDHHRPACQEQLSPDFNSSVLDLCDSTGRRKFREENAKHILMQRQKLRPQAQDLIIAALFSGAIPNFEM